MCKINSKEELLKLYRNVEGLLDLRKQSIAGKAKEYYISVCGGTGCTSSESLELVKELNKEILALDLKVKVKAEITGCFGFCEKGPIVKVFPDNTFYTKVKPSDAKEIIESHIRDGVIVERLLYVSPNKEIKRKQEDIDFYGKQKRIALRNCGLINPENIQESLAARAYQALANIITNKVDPMTVIAQVSASGIRGRGGAGFPTGTKWKFAAVQPKGKKYVVCNADEGDPGAFMDRSILEGDPHSVLEAMAIAGYSIGSDEGNIYIRAEYPLAVERLKIAIKQAEELGLLGDNILGTDFSFHIKIKYGAGAFVCGEETALIHSIEGTRGEPTNKPPFPAVSGLFGKPTIVNNVETFANLPIILLDGPEKYAAIGSEKSKGTKVFALAGKINNVGLVEVPMGTTLREIIYDIGGGIKNGKKFKAVQTGGPSGGCLTEKHLDTPIDYESLAAAGSMMGSGGMIVLDEDDCMPNIAKFYLEFTVEESCGKCTPCRVGNRRMLEILEKITKGEGSIEDLDRLTVLANNIKDTALCGLGQTAPNPILSTIANFKDEYLAHIVDKTCPAHACKALLNYKIKAEKCIACGMCARVCPVGAITQSTDIQGKLPNRPAYVIDLAKCIKCGSCIAACRPGAVYKD
ncbi:MAG: 4Fe-4S binding protein [Bacillales bacterium]|jgi:NADH-quinone oxidoreductase subunit F|nr:4Fe-4S binding protein [Bacillales bacterium]